MKQQAIRKLIHALNEAYKMTTRCILVKDRRSGQKALNQIYHKFKKEHDPTIQQIWYAQNQAMRIYGLYRETKDIRQHDGTESVKYSVKSFLRKKQKIDLSEFLRLG